MTALSLLQLNGATPGHQAAVGLGEVVEIACRDATGRRAFVDGLFSRPETSGAVAVVAHLPPEQIAIVANPPMLMPDDTVARCLEMGSFPLELESRRYLLIQADLAPVLLDGYPDECVGDLPLPQRLTINFAMALLRDPALLIIDGLLDDPTDEVRELGEHFEMLFKRRFPLRTVCQLVGKPSRMDGSRRRIELGVPGGQ